MRNTEEEKHTKQTTTKHNKTRTSSIPTNPQTKRTQINTTNMTKTKADIPKANKTKPTYIQETPSNKKCFHTLPQESIETEQAYTYIHRSSFLQPKGKANTSWTRTNTLSAPPANTNTAMLIRAQQPCG
jgi:hypothetical protein